jgi:hypothetical protein
MPCFSSFHAKRKERFLTDSIFPSIRVACMSGIPLLPSVRSSWSIVASTRSLTIPSHCGTSASGARPAGYDQCADDSFDAASAGIARRANVSSGGCCGGFGSPVYFRDCSHNLLKAPRDLSCGKRLSSSSLYARSLPLRGDASLLDCAVARWEAPLVPQGELLRRQPAGASKADTTRKPAVSSAALASMRRKQRAGPM